MGKQSRRAFLRRSAAAGAAFAAPYFLAASARGAAGKPPPSDRLNIACIGVGGMGGYDVKSVASENIVALCDVDDRRAAGTYKSLPKAKKFKDFRLMLEQLDRQIDAVTVSTPDHVHAPASMMAIRMGKHVRTQKPLSHSVHESRLLAEAARKHKVATQMGIQGHCFEGPRLLCEWVRAGLIGPVREVHIWTNRPIWPQGIDRPKDTPSVPDGLDWDLWLGPAPQRPYHPAYLPFNWRGWWDFGCGALGDEGCHMMDAPYWALGLGHPTSVEAVTSPVSRDTYPKWSTVTYEFPARGDMPPAKLVWYDGGRQPPRPPQLEPERQMTKNGMYLVGDKGTIFSPGYFCESPRVIPEKKMQELLPALPPRTIPRVPGTYQEWIQACKGGKAPGANFPDFAGPQTDMVLLGNVAIRVGQKIEWDGPNMRVTNVPQANRYIRREYRKGWTL